MSETLAERLDAVERALTDGEADLTDVRERAALSAELDRLDTRLGDVESRLDELDAAVEAVRGYAGNVRAVNRDVERRASAALAKAEALESALDATDDGPGDRLDGSGATVLSSTAEAGERDRGRRTESDGSTGFRSQHAVDTDSGPATERERATTTAERGDAGRRTPTVPDGPGERTRAGSGGRGEGGESGTEAFIERVRDAL